MSAPLKDASTLPNFVAAVDLGSNSFHMVVARTKDGEPVIVDRLREMVRLAAGLDADRQLSIESQRRALDCLKRFGERLRDIPSDCVRSVGTNTLRSARNAQGFLAKAEAALGHSIETISGIEEARLIYSGVSHSLARSTSRRLVLDIGGGSTELIIGSRTEPLLMESLYLGCVSMSRKHFDDGEITAQRWRKAELSALQELEPVQSRYRSLGWGEAVGASGSVRSIDAVVRLAGWSRKGITPRALERLRDALLKAGDVQRLRLEGLNPARQAVFVGGAVVLCATFQALGIKSMQYSQGALREGILYDLQGRIREKDLRARTVMALANRYHVDPEHAANVERTASRLLLEVADDWGLGSPASRQLLSWAAHLHEIGLDIAHQQYHKHGQYIVAASDLGGFSREEQTLLATLVRSHRRKFPVSLLKALPNSQIRMMERLAILLRLAVVLHRSRRPPPFPEPALAINKRTLQLTFPELWLDEHPLTRADLEQEGAHLGVAGYKLELT